MSATNSDLTVSLEPHLEQVLKPLLPILSDELRVELAAELDRPEIHYSLLLRISQWARTDGGKSSLESIKADIGVYHMVSLLAGTRTAPSSKLPPYVPPESPEAKSQREWNDRKMLTAVLNGLLSVGCAGGATWWAADKSGWRPEWKVILALVVAAIVGLSETVLLIIWQSKSSMSPKRPRRRAAATYKKSDGDGEPTTAPQEASIQEKEEDHDADARLRRRVAQRTEG
ncbi:hypothetical protein M0805_005839 [Coniferiporia weirii]|nr:hypothetical protein M0805_005839 [Coniferiporia weirii]